jgi:leucyl/phenylalanyl-tRNA--protein transferase
MYFLTDRLLFPDVEHADGEGLLAVGGDLGTERLLLAYRNGIFPWFNEDGMILWWSPDPRMVLFPDDIKISQSMRKVIDSGKFRITWNTRFEAVIEACSAIVRKGQQGTWITPGMKEAYIRLYGMGIAKSLEVWENDLLVGGLYGIDLGTVFCGESMFSRTNNASKFALIHLAQELGKRNYRLIDCQVYNPHLESMGAIEISRKKFMEILKG